MRPEPGPVLPSRLRSRHSPRHGDSASRYRLTVGVVAAAAAGATAIGGISVAAALGAIPARGAAPSAVALPLAVPPLTAGASRQNPATADSDGPLGALPAGARAPRPGKSRRARPAAVAKPSAKPAAKPDVTTRHHRAARRRASAGPSKPYEFYDSVTPQAVPAGAIVATYATGARPVPTSAVAGRSQSKVLWIDTLATDPNVPILDVEPGAASPSQVPGWASSRLSSHPRQVAIIYTSLSQWPQLQAEVASLPASMRSRIRWWVADPTGTPHLVPGSQATQWYWGSSYDISTAKPDFNRI